MKTANNTTCAIALAIAATLAACSAEGEPMGGQPQPIDPTTSVPLKVTAALQSSVTASATRATPTAVPLTKGSIGIFLQGTDYTAQNNVEYTATDGVWKPADPSKTIYLGNGNASVSAYYPYSSSNTSQVFAIKTQDYSEDAILCHGTPKTVNSYRYTAHFAMEHAYSRLRLHISVKDYPTAWSVTALSFYYGYGELALSATRDVVANRYDNLMYGTTYTFGNLPSTELQVGETYTRDLLLIPTSFTRDDLIVKMTINGQKLKAVIPKGLSAYKGKLYDINITVRGTEVLPVTVTTTNWEVVNVPGSYLPIP